MDVKGIPKIDKFLKSSDQNIIKARTKAFRKIGLLLAKQVKLRTPVKTGNLRRKVQYKFSNDILEIFSRVFYSDYVENGTKYQKPVHMFKNVYDTYYTKIPDMLAMEIESNLK